MSEKVDELAKTKNDNTHYENCIDINTKVNNVNENIYENNTSHEFLTTNGANVITENMEDRNLLNKKYEIDVSLINKLNFVLFIIFLQNIFIIALFIIFLCTEYYISALCTILIYLISVLLTAIICCIWDTTSTSVRICINILQYILFELIFYNKYKKSEKCQTDIKKFLLNDTENVLYRNAIRNIEEFRYYIIISALIYGPVQILVQFAIIFKLYNNNYILYIQMEVILHSFLLIVLCIWIYRSEFCDFKNELGIYRTNIFMYSIVLASILLYLSDIFSDIYVGIKYYAEEHYYRGAITLVFIIGPGIYNYWHERCFRNKKDLKVKYTNIFSILLNLNPVKGYYKSLKYILNTRQFEKEDDEKRQIANYQKYIENNLNVTSSRYFECFTESCCQIIIQFSFLLSTLQFSNWHHDRINIFSSIISVLNVGVSLVLFFRSKRIRNFEEEPLPIQGIIIQFLGYLPVASRLVALSFMASVLPWWTCLYLFSHWSAIFFWIIKYSEFSIPTYLNNAGQAIIYTYTPAINSVFVEIIFQIIFFIENLFALLLWNIYKYETITDSGIYLLIFSLIMPTFVGCICRYFYRTKYEEWINNYKKLCSERWFLHC